MVKRARRPAVGTAPYVRSTAMEFTSTKNVSPRVRWSRQADAFATIPATSMRYVLVLNGVVGYVPPASDRSDVSLPTGRGPKWLLDRLSAVAPEALPGPDGPIRLVLIL